MEDTNCRKFKLNDGRWVILEIEEFTPAIIVKSMDNKLVGRVELCELESLDFNKESTYKITWMFLDQINSTYTHQGIGRACLLYFKEYYQCSIIAAENDGIKQDDGSHLTGDAVGFINKMKSEGIVCLGSYDNCNECEE